MSLKGRNICGGGRESGQFRQHWNRGPRKDWGFPGGDNGSHPDYREHEAGADEGKAGAQLWQTPVLTASRTGHPGFTACRSGRRPLVPTGEVTHSGTGEGTVSVSGTPNNAYDIILKITEDGPLNTAAFCCSVNGGYSYDAGGNHTVRRKEGAYRDRNHPLRLRKNLRRVIPTGFRPRPRL